MSLLDTASLVITPNGYKEGKLYSVLPSSGAGDMTVTRATTATRVNSAGLIESVASNVPRLDYSNGTCPSILVEPQRTNLLTWSEDFTSLDWVKNNITITANSIISPDGNTNADTINLTNGSFCGLYKIGIGNVGIFTMSAFAKKGSKQWLYFVDLAGAGGVAWFDLNNGTIGNVINGTATIEDFGNGWFRCTYTNTSNIANSYFQLGFSEANNSVSITSSGNAYLYGAQLEAGSYATSYIPTTSASVTRNADVISKTGISSLIGQTEGTLLYDLDLNSRVDFNYILLGNLTAYIGFFIDSTAMGLEAVSGGLQGSIIYTNSNTGRFKIAIAYKQNDYAMYINGNLIGTDTSGNVTTCSEIDLTFNQKNSIDFNTVALWKTRLTNTQLAQLTTI